MNETIELWLVIALPEFEVEQLVAPMTDAEVNAILDEFGDAE